MYQPPFWNISFDLTDGHFQHQWTDADAKIIQCDVRHFIMLPTKPMKAELKVLTYIISSI